MLSNFDLKPYLKHKFIEYAHATTASKTGIKKGMNHLSFSRSLNSYLNSIGFKLKEKTDEN